MAKLVLLEGYRDRDGLDWAAAKLQVVDLQYATYGRRRASTTGSSRAVG